MIVCAFVCIMSGCACLPAPLLPPPIPHTQESTLLSHFGHCTQDLVNLLLTGRATSNVMDGDIALGDSGLMIKGVKKRAKIGYLTHLEALQLCQVGSFLKIPEVPVWMVGSTSHFTVLFCTDRQINEESESEKLQTRVQRAFKSVDNAECGFIGSDSLPLALMNIEEPVIYELLVDEEEVCNITRVRGNCLRVLYPKFHVLF